MNKKNYKVTDIFGYLPAKEMNLDELKSVFLNAISGMEDNKYIVSFDSEDLSLTEFQISATKELIATKSVAYISNVDEVIAVIGYKKKHS